MHRAARFARRRAEEAAKVVDGPDHSADRPSGVRKVVSGLDPRTLTFSQAQGYEEIPGPLALEVLPPEARVRIWNEIYIELMGSSQFGDSDEPEWVGGDWVEICESLHLRHHNRPLDEWFPQLQVVCGEFRSCIETLPFNQVFDLIQFVLRHPKCPSNLVATMERVFSVSRLAYAIDLGPPPTIIPAVTPVEGRAVVDALRTLREAALGGAASHLHNASERINAGDWAGSVRESIHAVESVARQLDPEASRTLGPALVSLEKGGALHPALREAFNKLYAYASDEQGVRHALLDGPDSHVGVDEAVFMLGVCASFASFLWRKHRAHEAT